LIDTGLPNGEAAQDKSGSAVALSADGSTVAVGAPYNDGNGSNSGEAWNQLGDDIDGEAADDWSGSAVALSADGSIVAVGAPRNDGNGFDSGYVRRVNLDVSQCEAGAIFM
jgi:hypothetical protein